MARILSVTACWLPERIDGTIVTIGQLARRWQGRGHAAPVFCRRLGSSAPMPVIDAARPTIVRESLAGVSVIRAEVPLQRRFGGGLDHPDVVSLFEQAMDEERPDLVHFHHLENLSSLLPGRVAARGLPSVITLHDFHLVCPTVQLIGNHGRLCPGPDGGRRCASCWPASARAVRAPGSLRGRLRRLADVALRSNRAAFVARHGAAAATLRGGSTLVSPTRFVAETVTRIAELPASAIEVIGNGADERASPRPCAAGTAPVVGFMGHLQRAKGPHLLAAALAGIADLPWSLRVHGDGPPTYRDELARLLPAGRTTWSGAYAPGEAEDLLAGIDVLVVPSTWPETFSLVTAQALAAGVPCVVAGWGGPAELVRDGVDGLHVKPGDADDLRETLRRLLGQPRAILDLAAGAAARPRRTWDVVADDYARLFARLGVAL